MIRWAALAAILVALAFAVDCTDVEGPQEAPPPDAVSLPEGHPPLAGTGEARPTGNDGPAASAVPRHRLVVPPSVQGRWRAVELAVAPRSGGAPSRVEASLNERTPIPGTALTVEPVVFLPSFYMGDGMISSVSNELNRPAARVLFREGETVVHEGWLFRDTPGIHPFEHPEVAVTLTGAVPAED